MTLISTHWPAAPQVTPRSLHRTVMVHCAAGTELQPAVSAPHALAMSTPTTVWCRGMKANRTTRWMVVWGSLADPRATSTSMISVTASSRGPPARGTIENEAPGSWMPPSTAAPRIQRLTSPPCDPDARTVAVIVMTRLAGTSVSRTTMTSVAPKTQLPSPSDSASNTDIANAALRAHRVTRVGENRAIGPAYRLGTLRVTHLRARDQNWNRTSRGPPCCGRPCLARATAMVPQSAERPRRFGSARR